MSERIDVALGERSYPIHVGSGLLARAGELLAPLACGAILVVADANVAPLQLEALSASLRASGLKPQPVVLEPGESTKSFRGLEQLIDALLDCGVDRGGLLVALGGGVIGDL